MQIFIGRILSEPKYYPGTEEKKSLKEKAEKAARSAKEKKEKN